MFLVAEIAGMQRRGSRLCKLMGRVDPQPLFPGLALQPELHRGTVEEKRVAEQIGYIKGQVGTGKRLYRSRQPLFQLAGFPPVLVPEM